MATPDLSARAPVGEDERVDWLRLLRSRRVGVVTFMRLLREHGSARDALRALPGIARAAGERDYVPCPEGVALKEYKSGLAMGARLLLRGDPCYPTLLGHLSDAPRSSGPWATRRCWRAPWWPWSGPATPPRLASG